MVLHEIGYRDFVTKCRVVKLVKVGGNICYDIPAGSDEGHECWSLRLCDGYYAGRCNGNHRTKVCCGIVVDIFPSPFVTLPWVHDVIFILLLLTLAGFLWSQSCWLVLEYCPVIVKPDFFFCKVVVEIGLIGLDQRWLGARVAQHGSATVLKGVSDRLSGRSFICASLFWWHSANGWFECADSVEEGSFLHLSCCFVVILSWWVDER